MTPTDLCVIALNRCNNIDAIKVKSSNLQGRLSGRMKRDLEELRRTVRMPTHKVEVSGGNLDLLKQ